MSRGERRVSKAAGTQSPIGQSRSGKIIETTKEEWLHVMVR